MKARRRYIKIGKLPSILNVSRSRNSTVFVVAWNYYNKRFVYNAFFDIICEKLIMVFKVYQTKCRCYKCSDLHELGVCFITLHGNLFLLFFTASFQEPHTQYQTPGTLFYQTTSNAPPPQPPPSIITYTNYSLPLRQRYHLELPPTSGGPVSKSDGPGQKPTQVYHINLDQPPISQAGGSGTVNSVQSQKPQITMEKISDRYHVEVKHDGPSSHGVPQPHQLPEGVVYTPLMPNMPLHANVMQITGGPPQVCMAASV